jgi:hypothetical protein
MFRQTFSGTMPAVPGPNHSSQMFEYVGRTALTVLGTVSRRMYRFERAGAQMEVDPRDVLSLSALPLLRRIK